jgi:uncharacterized protein YdhG (YjbR/CyaY superfamily)
MKKVASVDEFLAAVPADKRAALKTLRAAIRGAAPNATEGISYGVPTFKIDGHPLVSYGLAKTHCSFYLMSYAVMRSQAAALKGYKLGRGSVQFPADRPLPATLVRRLVKARIAEVEGAAAAKG